MNKEASHNENTVLKIFNYVGGTLIFLGVSYFIVDNWGSLNGFTKIFSTLGAAIAAFLVGALFQLTKKFESASAAFYMLSGLLLPIGLHVTLTVANVSWPTELSNLFISTLCLVVFLTAQLYLPRTIFLLFTIIFASLFYVSLLDFIVHKSNIIYSYLDNYEMIALGIAYICLGYYLDKNYKHELVGPLYFFGGLFVLAESFSLGSNLLFGYAIPLWEVLTPILIILAFMLSVPLRSKSFLYLGAIFLLLYICDISGKFIRLFGDMGWSLMLILLGLLLMLIGYLVIHIHQKINKIQ